MRRWITSTSAAAKVGVLKVRLYRPFSVKRFMEALPASVKAIAVLDRTKESGALGEPLYLDIVTALNEGLAAGWGKLKSMPKVVGGRYGLSSKDFTPAMVKAVFDNLAAASPKNHFTVGIEDDVTHNSLACDAEFSTESDKVVRALFYGLGSDGTVGANKNSIKIIGENTDNYAQGYFVYDSKKAGAVTISHLRFGPKPIRSIYLVSKANFVACHQPIFLDRYDMLKDLVPGGTFLLNTHHGANEIWDQLPRSAQEALIKKKLKFYVIDALTVAKATGMGARINTIMQTCFFALSGVLPREEAIEQIKYTIKKTYGRKGEEVVKKNIAAVDQTLANLFEVKVPAQVTSTKETSRPLHRRRPEGNRRDAGRHLWQPRRGIAGQRVQPGRHVPDRHGPLREAQPGAGNPGVGREDLHPVRQVRGDLPARLHPHEGLRREASARRARDVQEHGRPRARVEGDEVDAAGRGGRLHGLLPLRRSLPGQEQDRGQAQGDQHAPAAADPLQRARELQLLPGAAGVRPPQGQGRPAPPAAGDAAAVRIQRRLRRLRRDALFEAAHAAFRRPHRRGQRHGLLLHLQRQPADHPVCEEQGRPRPDLEQLAL